MLYLLGGVWEHERQFGSCSGPCCGGRHQESFPPAVVDSGSCLRSCQELLGDHCSSSQCWEPLWDLLWQALGSASSLMIDLEMVGKWDFCCEFCGSSHGYILLAKSAAKSTDRRQRETKENYAHTSGTLMVCIKIRNVFCKILRSFFGGAWELQLAIWKQLQALPWWQWKPGTALDLPVAVKPSNAPEMAVHTRIHSGLSRSRHWELLRAWSSSQINDATRLQGRWLGWIHNRGDEIPPSPMCCGAPPWFCTQFLKETFSIILCLTEKKAGESNIGFINPGAESVSLSLLLDSKTKFSMLWFSFDIIMLPFFSSKNESFPGCKMIYGKEWLTLLAWVQSLLQISYIPFKCIKALLPRNDVVGHYLAKSYNLKS